jgi:hypothetical protein
MDSAHFVCYLTVNQEYKSKKTAFGVACRGCNRIALRPVVIISLQTAFP